MRKAVTAVLESYATTGKLLVDKWLDYGSQLADGLESGYDSDRASAYLGTAVSLYMETGFRLMLEAMEAVETLNAGLDEKRYRWSKQLEADHEAAELRMKGDLAGFKWSLAADRIRFFPSKKLRPGQRKFKVRVNVTGCRPGIYDGTVIATAPSAEPQEIRFQIRFP
jgi:hypothetical protein